MEIANSRTLVVRPSERGDTEQIVRLLREAKYSHNQVDWRLPADELGTPAFVVGYSMNHGAQYALSSCLAVSTDQVPVSWVRLAAIRDTSQAQPLLTAMLERVIGHLQSAAINQLGWLAASIWPAAWLTAAGFHRINWICTYITDSIGYCPVANNDVSVRSASTEDIPDLVAIETAAFEPIWRHSEITLSMALREALSFDVATLDGKIAGFQYSIGGNGRTSAHLVRITVNPSEQGRGVGSALMAAAMNGYWRLGISRVTLNTQLDNVSSQRLYEKFGFSRTGDRLPVWSLSL